MAEETKYTIVIKDNGNSTDPEKPPLDNSNRDDWTYKDINDFYERVRIALGAVSESTLPDKYMDYPEKAPFAEAYIKSRVRNWAKLPNEKFVTFESIIVYETAVLFQSIVANRRIKKKEIPTISLEYSDKYDNLIGDMSLADMVEFLIDSLNEEEEEPISFSGFRVTGTANGQKRYCCSQRNFC